METVILILPLEAPIMNFPIDSRSDSGVTVEQQQFNFELFVPSLGLTWNFHQWSNSRSDSRATAVQFRIFCTLSRSDIKYSPVKWQQEWQWSNSNSISNCLYPLWAWHGRFTFFYFVKMGWFPIRILDNFRFSPNFKMGWFRQQSDFGQF